MATMDYNSHLGRHQQEDEDGEKKHQPLYRKRTKHWDVVLERKTYPYMPELIKRVFEERAASIESIRISFAGKRHQPYVSEQLPPTSIIVSSKKSPFCID